MHSTTTVLALSSPAGAFVELSLHDLWSFERRKYIDPPQRKYIERSKRTAAPSRQEVAGGWFFEANTTVLGATGMGLVAGLAARSRGDPADGLLLGFGCSINYL